jgi:hypothetical protein
MAEPDPLLREPAVVVLVNGLQAARCMLGGSADQARLRPGNLHELSVAARVGARVTYGKVIGLSDRTILEREELRCQEV